MTEAPRMRSRRRPPVRRRARRSRPDGSRALVSIAGFICAAGCGLSVLAGIVGILGLIPVPEDAPAGVVVRVAGWVIWSWHNMVSLLIGLVVGVVAIAWARSTPRAMA